MNFIPPKQKVSQIEFYAQWESPELIEKFIKKEKDATEDPKWKESGAKNIEEYKFWSWNICGMACLKMILKDRFNEIYPTIKLAKECEEFGGYKIVSKDQIDGLFYKPFCRYVNENFNLKAYTFKYLNIYLIKLALANNYYVMASVNGNIRYAHLSELEETGFVKGGHLVLITGYDQKKKVLYINNPSGFYTISQENYEISYDRFNKFFAKRGILLK